MPLKDSAAFGVASRGGYKSPSAGEAEPSLVTVDPSLATVDPSLVVAGTVAFEELERSSAVSGQ